MSVRRLAVPSRTQRPVLSFRWYSGKVSGKVAPGAGVAGIRTVALRPLARFSAAPLASLKFTVSAPSDSMGSPLTLSTSRPGMRVMSALGSMGVSATVALPLGAWPSARTRLPAASSTRAVEPGTRNTAACVGSKLWVLATGSSTTRGATWALSAAVAAAWKPRV